MAIDYSMTAHECAEALIMAPAMEGELWNDGVRWWKKNINSQWQTGPIHANDLRRIHATIPDDAYWARLRHSLTRPKPNPRIIKIMREACLNQLVYRPGDLNLHQEFSNYERTCLCWSQECRKPARPA